MLPDKFDGSSSWSDYVIHFESVAAVNQWTDDEKAMYLASHLRGAAREALADMVRGEYANILEKFEQRFGVTSQAPLQRAQLSMRVRGRGESLADLGQSIRRLVASSYP